MRITQGCFSFLPDLTDEQITSQVQYCLDKGWAVNIEFTDDPHPRNTYWEMWGLPMFDLRDAAGDHEGARRLPARLWRPLHSHLRPSIPRTAGSRCASPSSSTGHSTSADFRLDRQEAAGRNIRYATRAYAADRPEGERYQS